MSATALNVKITTSAELQALKATEQELLRQITAAKAAGKSLKDIGQEMKQLAGVQARMKEMGFVGRMQAEIQDMLTKIPALGRVMTAANGGAGLQTSGLGVLAGAAVAARSALAAFRRIEDLQTTFVTLLGSVLDVFGGFRITSVEERWSRGAMRSISIEGLLIPGVTE